MKSSFEETKRIARENNDLFRNKHKSSNKILSFSLPIPPSVNSLYVYTRRGKKLSRDAERYIIVARAKLKEVVDEQKWACMGNAEWLYVDMTYYFPDRIIRDASNCLKLLMDVMQGIVYANDYYAMPRIQGVEYDPAAPRVDIRIVLQTEKDRVKAKAL